MSMNTEELSDAEFYAAIEQKMEEDKQIAVQCNFANVNDMEAVKTKWLWYPYIPSGKITLMTADPGTGKTFLSLYIAAMVSNGQPFYGQEDFETREPRVAVYQTAEDGYADTIKPRLMKFKPAANLKNIGYYIEEQQAIDFSQTSDIIEEMMKQLRPALMIFDPLQAYLGADIDMHRANEVRPVLAKIGHLAEKYECAVLLVMHNSKCSGADPLYRALGSIDIVGIARSMLILGKNPDDNSQVVMCHEKSSLAGYGKSILFHIDNEDGIVFDGLTDMRASDILNRRKGSRDKASVKLDEATELLEAEINEGGWIEYSKVKELCEEHGISSTSIKRAKQALQLESFSTGFGKDKTSYWLYPDVNKEDLKQHHLCGLLDQPPF